MNAPDRLVLATLPESVLQTLEHFENAFGAVLRLVVGAGEPGAADETQLDAAGLRAGFRAYRLRLASTDLPDILGRGAEAGPIRDVLETYNEAAGLLSYFDTGAAGDGRALLIALHLNRLARAAQAGETGEFHKRVARRTGLTQEAAERVSSRLIHAAPELFGYFLALEASAAHHPDAGPTHAASGTTENITGGMTR